MIDIVWARVDIWLGVCDSIPAISLFGCQMDERAGPRREVPERCQKSEDSGKSETRRWRRKRIYSVVWGSSTEVSLTEINRLCVLLL